MENRITKKVDLHINEFKNEVKAWFDKNESDISGKCNQSDFLKFIFDFNNVSLSKDDFQKRKRVKNVVNQSIRCCAKRASGEQCTRRKKTDLDFCGTHIKGTPYGIVECNDEPECHVNKKDVWVQEIKGINYYIDNDANVYKHEDVLSTTINPEIIAKYVHNADGSYSIPDFGV